MLIHIVYLQDHAYVDVYYYDVNDLSINLWRDILGWGDKHTLDLPHGYHLTYDSPNVLYEHYYGNTNYYDFGRYTYDSCDPAAGVIADADRDYDVDPMEFTLYFEKQPPTEVNVWFAYMAEANIYAYSMPYYINGVYNMPVTLPIVNGMVDLNQLAPLSTIRVPYGTWRTSPAGNLDLNFLPTRYWYGVPDGYSYAYDSYTIALVKDPTQDWYDPENAGKPFSAMDGTAFYEEGKDIVIMYTFSSVAR